MKNSKQHPEEEATIREVHESDHESIIAIFNYYAATSYAAYPEIPVNDRFFAFLREGALAFYVLECEANVVGFGLMKPLLPFPSFMTTGMLTYFIRRSIPACISGKNCSIASPVMRKKWA